MYTLYLYLYIWFLTNNKIASYEYKVKTSINHIYRELGIFYF